MTDEEREQALAFWGAVCSRKRVKPNPVYPKVCRGWRNVRERAR